MLYSKFYLKNEVKIPTLLSIFIIVLSTYLIGRFFLTTSIPSRAQKGEIKKIEFVNIYPNQASVIWITEKPENWWLLYGESPSKLDKIAFDIRNISGEKIKYKNHFSLLKDLKNSTRYYLKLTDGKTLIADSANQPFSFETTEKLPPIDNLKPSFGTVLNSKGTPLENALVVLSIDNASRLATLTKNNGEWLIPMNYIINKLTKKQKIVSTNEKIKIEIYDELGNKSEVKTLISNLSPVSTKITIGKNYNFLDKPEVLGKDISNEKIDDVDFVYPKENAIISSSNPLIKGVGIAGNDLKVVIKSSNVLKTYNLNVKTDGTWDISTPVSLLPGKYSITLISKDKNNKEVKKTRSFEIMKSGERVLGESTPSATIETPEPTIATQTPVITETPTEVPTSTPVPTIPVSGGTIIPLSIVSASLIIIGVALLAL
jgi:hypothetical protein